MHIVAGLGNPSPTYAQNRHNAGFMVVDALARRWNAPSFQQKFQGAFVRTSFGRHDVVLLKPMTYMNLSGESVQRALAFFKVPLESLIVAHDELDLPFGAVRLKTGGGAAGHNGLKSIVQMCGGPEFVRARIGIGRPQSQAGKDYVLSNFSTSEKAELEGVIERVAEAIEAVIERGPTAAMNEFNVRQ